MPAKSNIWFSIVIGLSCLLIGFALSTYAYRYRYLRVPGGGLVERLNRDLDLTPAQRDKVGDILRDTRFKVMEVRQQYDHQRHHMFWQGLMQIRGILTPEQQAIFDREFSHHDEGDREGSAPPAGSSAASPAAAASPASP